MVAQVYGIYLLFSVLNKVDYLRDTLTLYREKKMTNIKQTNTAKRTEEKTLKPLDVATFKRALHFRK